MGFSDYEACRERGHQPTTPRCVMWKPDDLLMALKSSLGHIKSLVNIPWV